MSKTLYQVLGLDPSAEDVVVRAAFKALAQKYHPDKLKAGSAQGANLMVDINLSYKILSNPITRKRYDQALNESLGKTATPTHTSSNAAQRPQYHPSARQARAASQTSRDSSSAFAQPQEHEYVKLIQRIKANSVDEIELVNLFEKLFNIPLTIRHGYSNTYQFEENAKRYIHDFSSLKEVIIQKLSFEMNPKH
ncbi:MAG: J domain-containing protein [Burkholderiaceae bacterium]